MLETIKSNDKVKWQQKLREDWKKKRVRKKKEWKTKKRSFKKKIESLKEENKESEIIIRVGNRGECAD